MVNRSPYLDSRTKRMFDFAVCVVILVPALLIILLAALIVLVMDGGPAFFFQRRLGREGKLFWMAKIRTMHRHADPCRPSPMEDESELVTVTGSFIRKHRLDELPQVFSVLWGRMSLVGPRPEIPQAACEYGRVQRKRLCAKPGLTGLWQVLAGRHRPICRDIKYDLYYLRRASLRLDILILLLTIFFVVRPKGKVRTDENSLYTYKLSMSD